MRDWIIRYWIEFGFGVLITWFTFYVKSKMKKFDNKLKEQETFKLGIQALLRNEIYTNYKEYMEKGYFPIYAREIVESMYTSYHNLGGNGTATELLRKLNELPTSKEEEK